MLNKEKFEKEIMEITFEGGEVAVIKETGRPADCKRIDCNVCKFLESKDCSEQRREWFHEEYEERFLKPEDDLKIDDRVIVSQDGMNWHRRHFARWDGDRVEVFGDGCTSWSVGNLDYTSSWKYAKRSD